MHEDESRRIILDHYRSPRNRREIPCPNVEDFSNDPLCGDEMRIAATIEDGRLVDAGFEARSCSISQASADLMIEAVKGKRVEDVDHLIGTFSTFLKTTDPDSQTIEMGELEALGQVRRHAVRIRCALLPWEILSSALARYRGTG